MDELNLFTPKQLKQINNLMEITTQVCKKCKVEKKLSDFKKDMRGKLGRRRVCKKCLEKSKGGYGHLPKQIYISGMGILSYEEYQNIIKERVNERNKRAMERRKNYKWKRLNKPFAGSEAHHINKEYVIHIPKALHNYCGHNLEDGRGMVEANTLAFKYLLSNPKQISVPIELVMKLKETILS